MPVLSINLESSSTWANTLMSPVLGSLLTQVLIVYSLPSSERPGASVILSIQVLLTGLNKWLANAGTLVVYPRASVGITDSDGPIICPPQQSGRFMEMMPFPRESN